MKLWAWATSTQLNIVNDKSTNVDRGMSFKCKSLSTRGVCSELPALAFTAEVDFWNFPLAQYVALCGFCGWCTLYLLEWKRLSLLEMEGFVADHHKDATKEDPWRLRKHKNVRSHKTCEHWPNERSPIQLLHTDPLFSVLTRAFYKLPWGMSLPTPLQSD